VGGKTGVNHPGGKNLLGAFHQPRLVLIDTDTLSTLPDRELSAGLAEMIKHGAIADDVYFASLEVSMDRLLARERRTLADAIERSCEIKAAVVAEDEREIGKRALLNFGHTFAHAIENSLGYGEWLHGEAVAAGMQMAAQLGELGDSDCQRLRALTELAGLPVTPPRVGADKLRGAMKLDKKAAAGALRFVLLERIGSAYITDRIPAAKLDLILQQAEGRQPR
jgi:3-dehydroquinate synthase